MIVDEIRGKYVTMRLTHMECINLANALERYEKSVKQEGASNPRTKKELRQWRAMQDILGVCARALQADA